MRNQIHFLCGLLVALVGIASQADEARDSSLEIIQFKAPAGWSATDKPGQPAKVYLSPDSTASEGAFILIVLSGPQSNLDLPSAFDAAVKQIAPNAKVEPTAKPESSKTRQGFDALSQTVVAQPSGGPRIRARVVAANVNNRLATFCYMATSQKIFEKHLPEMDTFLKSVNFTAGSPNASAAAKSEYETLELQKQDLLKKIAVIDARQRELIGSIASTGGVAKAGVPIGMDDALLATAKEQFLKEVDRRRKPHTVLGSVLTLEGRPIPNVANCSISVTGTTIAAERTHYNIDVDKNGHYELQVPDGLYKVFPTCIVTLYGHQVQADLIPIDDKSESADQSSAQGIVKDFRLVLSALRPQRDPTKDDSYFGGIVRISDPTYTPQKGQIAHRHPGMKIRVTFVPLGPVIDGSKIEPFAVDLDAARVGGGERLYRVPLGSYRVTAALVGTDGKSQALSVSDQINGTGTSVDVYWEKTSDFSRADPQVYVRD